MFISGILMRRAIGGKNENWPPPAKKMVYVKPPDMSSTTRLE
jgi:hypothetical protein